MPGGTARRYGRAMSTTTSPLSPHEIEQIELANATGLALTIDSGWREVADTALAFVNRFVLGPAA
jgi:hypothetical protein